jgi:membrane protein
VGPDGADLIRTMLDGAQKPAAGIIATILGVIGLVLGALGAFGQLQDALNTIWEVKPKEGRGIRGLIQDRLLSLSMVLVVGFLLMVSLVVSAGLSAVGNVVGGLLPESELLLSLVNFIISFVVITVLFALMFKYLPDAKIAWADVWIGAAITALLFTIGKQLIGLYLGNSTTASSYGAAGSLVVLLLWVYYSAQIFLLGAEFTQVYANQFGSRVQPAANAEPVTAQDRAQQGLPHEPERQAGQPRPNTAAPAPLPPAPIRTAANPPHELPRAGDGYIVSLLAFLTGLGAGAVLGGQNFVEPPVQKRKKR